VTHSTIDAADRAPARGSNFVPEAAASTPLDARGLAETLRCLRTNFQQYSRYPGSRPLQTL